MFMVCRMSANWRGGLGGEYYPTFFTVWAKRSNLPFKISHVFQLRKQAEVQSVILQGTSTTYFQACLQYCVPAHFLHPRHNLLLARKENDKRPPGNEKQWESLPSTHAASLPVSYQEADLELCSFYGLKFWHRHSPNTFSTSLQQPQRLGFWQILAHSDHAVLLLALITLSASAGKKACMEGEKKLFSNP